LLHTKATVKKTVLALLIGILTISISAYTQGCSSDLYTNGIDVQNHKPDFLFVLPGGGTIFGGRAFSNSAQIGVVKTTPGGDIVFNKRIEGLVQSSEVSKACLTKENNILVAVGPNLILLDTNGIYLKAVATEMAWGEHYVRDIKIDVQGNIFALFESFGGGTDRYLLAKIPADLSSVQWAVTFAPQDGSLYRSLTVDGDNVFTVGSYSQGPGDTQDGSVLCFDRITGGLTKQVSLTLAGFRAHFKTIHKTKGGYLLEGFHQGFATPTATDNRAIVRLDDLLRPIKAVRLTNVSFTDPLFIEPDDDGGYYGCYNSSQVAFFHCDNRDSVTWATLHTYYAGFGVGLFTKSQTNLYALEQTSWTIFKADLNGYTGGCSGMKWPGATVPITIGIVNKTLTAKSTSLTVKRLDLVMTDRPFRVTTECRAVNPCSSVTIIGQKGVCTSGTPILFKGRRNTSCRLPVQWTINGSLVDRSLLNDSTLSVRFVESGRYQFIASLPSTCQVIADTLTVDVTVASQAVLNLGNDTTICEGNTIRLSASRGFVSYLWQDAPPTQPCRSPNQVFTL
jgi:hypothetical protein